MQRIGTPATRALLVVLACALSACRDATSPSAEAARPDESVASHVPDSALPAGDVIPGQYIVVFKDDVADPRGLASQLVRRHNGTPRHTYTTALKGFSAGLSPRAVAALRSNPNVAYIQPVRTASLQSYQGNPPWGLDRIDQRSPGLNSRYTFASTGADVNVYVIDSGIRASHQQFGGRVRPGFSVYEGMGTGDCLGHGTFVAGIIGGATYGVAKGVILHPVRVFDCSGVMRSDNIIFGVDWVAAHHVKPAVANASFAVPFPDTALNQAVWRTLNLGVTFVIAAGNHNVNACVVSPASVQAASAITVGATGVFDQRWTTSDPRKASNTGTCVDLFAPGESIPSAWYTDDAAVWTESGTSVAAPHVAGVAALILQLNPAATPLMVRDRIVGAATPVQIGNAGSGSPNRLLYALATPAVFDPTTYRALHPDLAGMSDFDLAFHYTNAGINEGRQAAPAFAPADYRALNADLSTFNNQTLLGHLVEWGVDEGRQTSPVFNGNDYRFFQPDLAGFSNRDVFVHYIRFGVSEGRMASIVYEPAFYRSAHPDLASFGNRNLLHHYLQWGINEGRPASVAYDPRFYRSNHTDLAGMTYRQLLHHYLVSGIHEGRRASAQFDPAAYRHFNPELANHSNRALVTDYLRYGRSAGRRATF